MEAEVFVGMIRLIRDVEINREHIPGSPTEDVYRRKILICRQYDVTENEELESEDLWEMPVGEWEHTVVQYRPQLTAKDWNKALSMVYGKTIKAECD